MPGTTGSRTQFGLLVALAAAWYGLAVITAVGKGPWWAWLSMIGAGTVLAALASRGRRPRGGQEPARTAPDPRRSGNPAVRARAEDDQRNG